MATAAPPVPPSFPPVKPKLPPWPTPWRTTTTHNNNNNHPCAILSFHNFSYRRPRPPMIRSMMPCGPPCQYHRRRRRRPRKTTTTTTMRRRGTTNHCPIPYYWDSIWCLGKTMSKPFEAKSIDYYYTHYICTVHTLVQMYMRCVCLVHT